MKAYWFFLVLLLAGWVNEVHSKSISECPNPHKPGRSLTSLFKNATSVYLATPLSFREEMNDGFGNYTFDVLISIKGKNISRFDMDGYKPLEMVPQEYFDALEFHERIDLQNLPERSYINQNMGEGCKLYPDFVVGYKYLIFLGVSDSMSFEPINSINMDKWYQSTYQLRELR